MIPRKTIQELIRTQGEKCDYCGTTQGLEIHHKKRRGAGGSDHIENLVILCHTHHEDVHHRNGEWTNRYRTGIDKTEGHE